MPPKTAKATDIHRISPLMIGTPLRADTLRQTGPSIKTVEDKVSRFRKLSTWPWPALLWIGAGCSIVGMAMVLPVAWDLAVIQQAMRDLRGGLDPYVAELARLAAIGPRAHDYNVYPYPPVTLIFLRFANLFPTILGRALFWIIYAAGFGAQLWAGFQLALPAERRILRYALPLVVFFPGFMPNEVILCGNLAIPIYGAVLAAAILGWKKNQWGWFYMAVLAGSLFKPPFLALLAIPMLVGTAQVVRSSAAAGFGVLLFAVQRLIWPTQFSEYLRLLQVESIFRHNAGHFEAFGFSAAGVLASVLQAMGRPFGFSSTLFYLAYSGALFLALIYFAWQYRQERIGRYTFMTVLVVGALLLSPRILQYDTLPVTLPMFLLLIRGWKNDASRWIIVVGLGCAFAAFLANKDALEISLTMWTLLMSGVVSLRREAQFAKVSAYVEALEPVGEPELEGVSL